MKPPLVSATHCTLFLELTGHRVHLVLPFVSSGADSTTHPRSAEMILTMTKRVLSRFEFHPKNLVYAKMGPSLLLLGQPSFLYRTSGRDRSHAETTTHALEVEMLGSLLVEVGVREVQGDSNQKDVELV